MIGSASPLVSICIPTYNAGAYVEAALASVDEQTYRNLEVVISDDGSNDGTQDRIREYERSSRYPVRFFQHAHDTIAGNWNHCIAKSAGKYVKFLFQDDRLEPTCVAEMVGLAERFENTGLVFSPRRLIFCPYENSEHCQQFVRNYSVLHTAWSKLQTIQDGRSLLSDPCLFSNPLNKIGEPTVVLLNRELLVRLGGFDGSLCQLVDLDMWWRVMQCSNVAFVDKILSEFRVHSRQASCVNLNSGESDKDTFRFLEKVRGSTLYDCLSESARQELNQSLGLTSPPTPVAPALAKPSGRAFLRRIVGRSKRLLHSATKRLIF